MLLVRKTGELADDLSEGPQIGHFRCRKMLPAQCHQCVAIPALQRGDHLVMFVSSLVTLCLVSKNEETNSVRTLRIGLYRAGEIVVAAQPEKLAMKFVIVPEDPDQIVCIDRRVVPCLDRLEFVNMRLLDRKNDLRGSGGFQQFANGIKLLDVGGRERPYHCTAIGKALDQAHLVEFRQREPQGMARDGKPFGKLFLDKTLARMKPAENDIFLESHHHCSDRVLACGFCLGFAARRFLHVFLDSHVFSPFIAAFILV